MSQWKKFSRKNLVVVKININPVIEKIFKNFKVDGKKIPIAYSEYFGKEEPYLTYYTWLEKPHLFADDTNQSEYCYFTVDVWSKGNFKNIVEAVKQKLKENDFVWTDTASELYEPETAFFHVPINFYAVKEVISDE